MAQHPSRAGARFAAASLALLATQAAGQREVKVGEGLFALRLPTIDGDATVDLARYRGRKLLLVEFASW